MTTTPGAFSSSSLRRPGYRRSPPALKSLPKLSKSIWRRFGNGFGSCASMERSAVRKLRNDHRKLHAVSGRLHTSAEDLRSLDLPQVNGPTVWRATRGLSGFLPLGCEGNGSRHALGSLDFQGLTIMLQ